MLLRSPDQENSVKSERDIGEDVDFAPHFPRSRSMVFKEKSSRALSEQHRNQLGQLSIQHKLSDSSDNDDDDELSLGFLFDN